MLVENVCYGETHVISGTLISTDNQCNLMFNKCTLFKSCFVCFGIACGIYSGSGPSMYFILCV